MSDECKADEAHNLLPCPFCGTGIDDPEFPASSLEGGGFAIECGKCGACWPTISKEQVQAMAGEAELNAAWNIRAPAASSQEPVAWQHRLYFEDTGKWSDWRDGRHPHDNGNDFEERPLYATPLHGEQP